MDNINYYFSDHWGGFLEDTDIKLYEVTWNDWGYHGFFEFVALRNKKLHFEHNDSPQSYGMRIGRIDGHKMELNELHKVFGNKNVNNLPKDTYITFPSKKLCIAMLLNLPLETRKKVAKDLCFNFGEGINFLRFKSSKMYKKAILRNLSEEDFLEDMKERKKILFCDLPISEWLSTKEL